MLYCSACGSRRIDQNEYCGNCGSAFAPLAPATAESAGMDQSGDTRVRSSTISDQQVNPSLASHAKASRSESATTLSRGARPWQIATGFLVVGMICLALATFTTNQALDGAKAEVASTSSALASTQADLTGERANRAEAEDEVRTLTDVQATLRQQLGGREACITAQRADQTELDRLYELLRANFNRSAKGSVLADADIAREKALSQGLDFYYQGYSRAYAGNYSSANSSIDKGNAAIKIADAKLKIVNAETKEIDKTSDLLSKDLDALGAEIANTMSICQGTAADT